MRDIRRLSEGSNDYRNIKPYIVVRANPHELAERIVATGSEMSINGEETLDITQVLDDAEGLRTEQVAILYRKGKIDATTYQYVDTGELVVIAPMERHEMLKGVLSDMFA